MQICQMYLPCAECQCAPQRDLHRPAVPHQTSSKMEDFGGFWLSDFSISELCWLKGTRSVGRTEPLVCARTDDSSHVQQTSLQSRVRAEVRCSSIECTSHDPLQHESHKHLLAASRQVFCSTRFCFLAAVKTLQAFFAIHVVRSVGVLGIGIKKKIKRASKKKQDQHKKKKRIKKTYSLIGLLCCSPGLVVCGSFGNVVPWSFGPLVLWSTGPLVPWSLGPLVHWSASPPVCWSSGPVVRWSPGILVLLSPGPLVFCSPTALVCRSPGPCLRKYIEA